MKIEIGQSFLDGFPLKYFFFKKSKWNILTMAMRAPIDKTSYKVYTK